MTRTTTTTTRPLVLLALLATAACSSPDGVVGAQDGGGSSRDGVTVGIDAPGTGPDGAPGDGPVVVQTDGGVAVHDPDGGAWTCYPTTCRGRVLACGDCRDNDGDGLIDAHDPECLGPCSNSEGPTLYPDEGGGSAATCMQNCYFNFGVGSGMGEGGCIWDHTCDPHEVAPGFDPQGSHCAYNASAVGGRTCPATQSALCVNTCEPLTPNGCDCFGCCTFDAIHDRPDAMGGAWVYLGSMNGANNPTCDYAHITDVGSCRPCQPVESCINTCTGCEVCVGEQSPDPSRCASAHPADAGTTAVPDGGLPGQCAAGVQPCGLTGEAGCPAGSYCITGCCIAAPM